MSKIRDLEGPDVRPHGLGQEVGNVFSVMRILWNGCKRELITFTFLKLQSGYCSG